MKPKTVLITSVCRPPWPQVSYPDGFSFNKGMGTMRRSQCTFGEICLTEPAEAIRWRGASTAFERILEDQAGPPSYGINTLVCVRECVRGVLLEFHLLGEPMPHSWVYDVDGSCLGFSGNKGRCREIRVWRLGQKSAGVGLSKWAAMKEGDRFPCDGDIVVRLVDPILHAGYSLIQSVDAWLTVKDPAV